MRFHQAAAAVWDESAGGGGGGGGNISPTPPKLSLFSLPAGVKGSSSVRHYSPGPTPPTPPINRLASVPFKWEEAPGKPRPPRRFDHQRHVTDGDGDQSKFVTRCLELPPRLVVSNVPPPACLGEDEGRQLSAPRRSMSFTSGSGRSPPTTGRRVGFGSSSRWGNLVMRMTSSSMVRNKKGQKVSNFDSTEIIVSSSTYYEDDQRSSHGERNGKMTRRIRRPRSLFNLSAASRPQACLNSMYRSFKKIVMVLPTRRS